MQHKRVLIVVSNPLGGIRTYMLYNLRPMLEEGFRFTFLAPASEPYEFFKRDLADWPDVEFVDADPSAAMFSMARETRRLLKKRRSEFALIHAQGLRAGTLAALADLCLEVPLLITLHDVLVPGNDHLGHFPKLKQWCAGRLTRHASTIIPVSEDCAANHLEHFPIWKKGPCRIHPILNGIDVQRLVASRDVFEQSGNLTLRCDLGLDDDVVLAGFFGRLMPQKGFLPLIDALHLLFERGFGKRLQVVVTRDECGLREYVGAVASRPEVAEMVTFIPPVADIAPLFDQVDLLLMPSLWEACGLLAMEAMVLGVPVIGSNCIGLREVLRGTPSLTPEAGNATALADAIESFLMNPFTAAARSYAPTACERFDVRRAAAELLAIYRETVAGSEKSN